MLTREVEEYYDNFNETFSTKGWSQIKNILLENAQNIDISKLKDAKDLHLAQGQLHILKMLLELPEHTNAQREYVEAQDNAEDA